MRDEWGAAALVGGMVAGQAGVPVTGAVALVCAVVSGAAVAGPPVRRALCAFGIGLVVGVWSGDGGGPAQPTVSGGALPRIAIVRGVVDGTPVVRRDRTVVVLALAGEEREGAVVPLRARVRVTLGRAVPLEPGSTVRAALRLRRPRNFRTPGAFDWEGHLARRGILLTASAREMAVIVPARGPAAALARWRRRIAEGIEASGDPASTAILRALVIGEDGDIPAPVREAFARAGVVHVLSVSGLHLALVTAAAAAVVRWWWGRSAWLLLRTSVDVVAAAAGAVAAVGYGTLAGLATPTIRSVAMVLLALGASVVGRRPSPLHALALTAAGIMYWRPGVWREAGFQLSFVSVLALLAAARAPAPTDGTRSRRALVATALRASTVASVATAPLTAWHFHQVSLVAPLANLVVIPLFGSVVLGPALAGAALVDVVPAGAHLLFATAARVVRVATALVTAIGGFRWAAVETPLPTGLEVLGVAALLLGPRVPVRRVALAATVLAGACLIVDAGISAGARGTVDRIRVTFLDVGQGDAAVAELPDGRVVLVDAGGFPASDFDVGDAVVRPFLAARRIRTVDLAVVTHPHPDHFAGMAAVVESHPVSRLWWNGVPARDLAWARLQHALAAAGVAPERVVPAWDVPGWPGLSVLHPPPGWRSGVNDGSVVVRFAWRQFAVLFTGDAERLAEGALADGGWLGPAAVLKVAHHGSRTSSTPALLDRVRPAIAVISAGADNRYGHPAPEVEARYRARGVCVLRTDRCGAVTVESDGRWVQATAVDPGCRCPPIDLTRLR